MAAICRQRLNIFHFSIKKSLLELMLIFIAAARSFQLFFMALIMFFCKKFK